MKVIFKVNGTEIGEEAALYESDNRYEAILKTKSLYITSIKPEHATLYYKNLFSDPRVMELYGKGNTFSEEEAKTWVAGRVDLWNNKYPFSAFSIFQKNPDGTQGQL